MRALLSAFAVLLGLGGLATYLSYYIVHQNQQALLLAVGKPIGIIDQPGLHWKIPLYQTVEFFDKRILDLETKPQEITASDQKRLVVDAFGRYRITDPLRFYQAIQNEAGVRRTLGPIMDSAMRRVLGGATFQELVRDKREDLMKRIAKQVNEEGKELGLEVVDVRIRRADLPPQNSKSVFDRMRSERQREAAEFRAQGAAEANRIRATADREATVIKAEATRKSDLLRGDGEGERNQIFAEAYGRDVDFFRFYRNMQAYETGIKPGTKMLLSPDSEFLRYLTNPSGLARPKQ
jgi:modulator of FtsH protease HflC